MTDVLRWWFGPAHAMVVATPGLALAECVVASSAKVRDEPSADATVVGTLPIEAAVGVTHEQDGWVSISVS